MNIKRILFGNPIRTEHAEQERLNKKTALAVFSSDALSSTDYATEEILLVLAVAVAFGQTTSFNYVVPISIAIAVLLAIVVISYRQTVHAYPSGARISSPKTISAQRPDSWRARLCWLITC